MPAPIRLKGSQHMLDMDRLEKSQAEANVMETMQRVFDLAHNNESQKMLEAERNSPYGQRLLRSQTKAGIATNEAEIAKSWAIRNDKQMEVAEGAFALYNASPSAETYKATVKALQAANPALPLPTEYTPENAKILQSVQRSYLNNRSHRQKLAEMGFNTEMQLKFGRAQWAQDENMLDLEIEGRLAQLHEQMNRQDYQIALKGQIDKGISRMNLEPELQLIEALRAEGRQQEALALMQNIQERQWILANLKAQRSGSGDPLKDTLNRQKITEHVYDNTEKSIMDTYSKAGKFDKDMKTLKGRSMGSNIRALWEMGQKFGWSPESAPEEIQDRMVLWPERKTWVALPLDQNGQPLLGLTSSDIMGLIGTNIGKGGGYNGTIDDLDEAMEAYQLMMKDIGAASGIEIDVLRGASGPRMYDIRPQQRAPGAPLS